MSKKLIGAAVILGVLGGLSAFVYLITTNKVVIGYNIGYQPEQPIPFSHELHAGTYKINCQYCHSTASVSKHASVPSLNICMNCHLTVATTKPNIQKIADSYNQGMSIPWQKVHLLPDFVRFNHAPHVAAGKACQECHGAVETMPIVTQVQSLSMGWCVQCHRKPENNAPTSCSTCHY